MVQLKRLTSIIGYALVAAALAMVTAQAGLCAKIPATVASTPQAPIQARNTSASRQGPVAIALADIASQAATVSAYLDSLGSLTTGADSKNQPVENDIPKLAASIDQEMPAVLQMLQERPSLSAIQEANQKWQLWQQQLTRGLAVLTAHVSLLQNNLDRIESLRQTWLLTRTAAQASNAPPQLIQQVDGVIESLNTWQPPLDYRRRTLLVLQDSIVQQLTRCNTMIAKLNNVQQQGVVSILTQDSPPLWSAELRTETPGQLVTLISSAGAGYLNNLGAFLKEPPRTFLFQCGLFPFLLALLSYMHRRTRKLAGPTELPPAFGVLKFPLNSALFITFIFGAGPVLNYPQSIRLLMEVLAVVPMILLARPVVDRNMCTPLYTLGVIFTLDTVRRGLAGVLPVEQILLLIEAGAAIAVLRGVLAHGPSSSSVVAEAPSGKNNFIKRLSIICLLVLAIGCGATVFGYLRLARLMVSTIIVGGILALMFFTYLRVMEGIVAFLLRNWPFTSLRMVSHHLELLERRIYKLFVWVAILTWLARILDYLGLFSPGLDFSVKILDARMQRGAVNISVGDVILFVMTVWLSSLLASFLSFVLNEDIFPRTRMSAGVSYAVSNLLRYLIIVVGFIVGLGVLGVTVDRLMILVSALGVGIGFGLQAVVNNFISGLILLFERPIHVGDTVEFGAITGEVRQIGIRSSKVHTWQGADIIVPNSQLISESVTNWTFSDQLRRIDLPLGVNYGADPQEVISLLQEEARKNPRILDYPPCVCLFTGFGDSSINFELRAWTDNFSNWYMIRSELAVAVYGAVRKAGISFPFPQREVRLLQDPEPVQALPDELHDP
jgi:potassium efflux system protein